MIIIVSGSVCSGKSTLAKQLAREINHIYIDVSKIIKQHKIGVGFDKKRNCTIVDTKELNKELINIIKENKNLVIDSHLSHYISAKYVDLCIITKCNLKKLNNRLKQRKYSKQKIKDNLEAEIFDVCSEEAKALKHKIKILDTSNQLNHKLVAKQLKLKQAKFPIKEIQLTKAPIKLITLNYSHIDNIVKNGNHPSIAKFTSAPYPFTKKTAEKFIQLAQQNQAQQTSYNFGIQLKKNIIGTIGLFNINKKLKSAELET